LVDDGVNKACRREYRREYYAANKEKIAAYQREYYAANKEKIAAYKREYHCEYYAANKEKIAARKHNYYEANKEKILESLCEYRETNKEKIAVRERKYRETNKEKIAACGRKYRETNKEKIAGRHRKRTATDPNYKLSNNLRVRLYGALKNNHKKGSAVRDLGCTVPELWDHLENNFQAGMTRENYGEWHVDHIKPLASFDLTDREQLKKACHWSNLQPLWAEDNIRKGAGTEWQIVGL